MEYKSAWLDSHKDMKMKNTYTSDKNKSDGDVSSNKISVNIGLNTVLASIHTLQYRYII